MTENKNQPDNQENTKRISYRIVMYNSMSPLFRIIRRWFENNINDSKNYEDAIGKLSETIKEWLYADGFTEFFGKEVAMMNRVNLIETLDPYIDNNLDGFEIEENEYAPKKIRKIEAIIYDWIFDTFGPSEAKCPSWNINYLTEEIHDSLNDHYRQSHAVRYLNEGQYDEEIKKQKSLHA